MFGVLSITVVSTAIDVIYTSGLCARHCFNVPSKHIIKHFMGLHMEIEENEMYSHDDPRMKIHF